MPIITKKLNKLLKAKKLSQYKLAKLIDYERGALGRMIRGEKSFPIHVIQKIAPILEVSPEEIKGWILADKYSREVLEKALQLKQELTGQDNLIFTSKINVFMKEKKLNICAFSRKIEYNQGLLSQVLLGNEPVSKKLIQKICAFFECSEGEIKSWIVADKYLQKTLEEAIKTLKSKK